MVGGLTAITMLAACGGSAGEGGQNGPSSGAAPIPSADMAPTTQLSVPEGIYDTSRGWESEVPDSYAVLPHTKKIVFYPETHYPEESPVTAIDVTSGNTVWTSVPLGPASEETHPKSRFGATVRGEDYFVVWGTDAVNGGALAKAEDVTVIDIFTATGSGEAVEPAHHVEVDGLAKVRDGGGGLIAEHEDGGITSVDPATGATVTYLRDELEPPSACTRCRQSAYGGRDVVAITPAGPLVTSGPDAGFWVPGAWSIDTLAPDLASSGFAKVTLVSDDVLTVMWYVADTNAMKFGILDGATGELGVTVECQLIENAGLPSGGAQLSSNRRYLAGSYIVLDLETGRGHCYVETDTNKAVGFRGVTDTGTAFGKAGDADAEEEATPVLIDIATGEVTEADPAWAFPEHDVGGFGLFRDLSSGVLVAYPHAE